MAKLLFYSLEYGEKGKGGFGDAGFQGV